MVKHFTNDEADAGSTPADTLYVTLNYLILNRKYNDEIIFLKIPRRGIYLSTFLIVYPYVNSSFGEMFIYRHSWLLIHTLHYLIIIMYEHMIKF